MEFKEFLDKQEEVYSRFRNTTQVRAEGVTCGIKNTGGYFLGFRHPEPVTKQIEEVSGRIVKVAPSIYYDRSIVHSTLSDLLITPIDEFSPDNKVLDGLCLGIKRVKSRLTPPIVSYNGFLYNQTAVIVEGNPEESYFRTSEEVINSCKDQGLDLRLPWGAHITVARFTESKTPEQLGEFYKLMENLHFSEVSSLHSLDIGSFSFTNKGLEWSVYERFKL